MADKPGATAPGAMAGKPMGQVNHRVSCQTGHQVDLFALTAPITGAGKEAGDNATELSGQYALAGFKRLIAGLPEQADTQVQWFLRGKGTTAGRRFIDVRAQAQVTLECQRCLQPFVLPLQVENRLEVVRRQSDLDGDEEIERIVGSARFEVLDLIEDELILSLPSIPRHDVCPAQPGAPESSGAPQDEAKRPSPFAALKQLKKDRS